MLRRLKTCEGLVLLLFGALLIVVALYFAADSTDDMQRRLEDAAREQMRMGRPQ